MGEWTLPALGGLLLRHNRRYGGFVVHLAILVVAVGVTGSQAWSVQTETTLKRGEEAALAGYRVRFDGLRESQESNHGKVTGSFTVVTGRGAGTVLEPAKKFYPQEQSPIAYVDYRLGFVDDVYLVLGDFARDGSSATVKMQVNRMVSWIWIGGLVLTLGTLLAILPERRKAGVTRGWRWLLPLAAVPVLALLAYGFRSTRATCPPRWWGGRPRRSRSPAFDGAKLRSGRRCAARSSSSTSGPRGAIPPATRRRRSSSAAGEAYRDRGVVVVGVDIQDKDEAARKFIRDFRPHLPQRARSAAARSRSTTACTACRRRSSSTARGASAPSTSAPCPIRCSARPSSPCWPRPATTK